MPKEIIKLLSDRNIHSYGSIELEKFEKQMVRYFEREYKCWLGNSKAPEEYGLSSFKGELAKNETDSETINHYNNEFALYQAFLDKDFLAYTMANYGASDNNPVINNKLSLEQAQVEKYKLLVERVEIQDGHNILDLGCGFGGFMKYLLATFPNVTVTGINPSIVQSKYVSESLTKYSTRYNLVSRYVGETSNEEVKPNSYDRVVSVGVLEHFTNVDLLFSHLEKLLKPGGKCLHHLIVSIDTIPQFLNAESTLMADYFPGGHIWPYSELQRHNKHLRFVNSWFINGLNYWKTLDEWHKRYWDSIEELYPKHLTLDEVEHWNKYFSLCKAIFLPNLGKSNGNAHYLYEKA